MNEVLIQNWNAVVSPGDLVYHLGDFGFGDVVPILRALNGRKVLILGNHDKSSRKPEARLLFDHLASMETIEVEGQTIVLCHYGMQVWPKSSRGSWHLFGHSHGTLKECGKSMDVGVDATRLFRPISYAEVVVAMGYRSENLDFKFGEDHVKSV
jgi:calcineurin-like phosphoesterase family protein